MGGGNLSKGFAISGVLYPILILVVFIIVQMLTMLGTRKMVLDQNKNQLIDSLNSAGKVYTNEELTTLLVNQQEIITSLQNNVTDMRNTITDMHKCTAATTIEREQFITPANFSDGSIIYYKCGNTVTVNINGTMKKLSGNGCLDMAVLPYVTKMKMEAPMHGSYGKSISGSVIFSGNTLGICQNGTEQVSDGHGVITFGVES